MENINERDEVKDTGKVKAKRMPREKKTIENGKIVKNRKGNERTNQPVKLPENSTWLKQPNLVTLMNYDFKLTQIRILISVIEKLQFAIEESINNPVFEQLSLFQNINDKNKLILSIKTKDFGITPDLYPELRTALKDLATIPVELDTTDPISGAPSWAVTGLFKAYIPKEKHSRTITIEIEKDVAKALVVVNKGFTRFIKEIAFSTQSKYTVRIYMLISSWKDKGGFSIRIDRFKKMLKIENKYPEYKDLYKRIIRPVYEELFEKANCWFEVAEVYNEGENEPYKLNFKVIRATLTYKEQEYLDTQIKGLTAMMFNHLKMEDKHISKVIPFINTSNIEKATNKILKLDAFIKKNWKQVTSIPDYCTESLVKELSEVIEVIEESDSWEFVPNGK